MTNLNGTWLIREPCDHLREPDKTKATSCEKRKKINFKHMPTN